MKTLFTAWLIGLLLVTTAFRSDRPATPPQDGTANVYIYRGGQFMAATLNYSIYANGKKICKLSNGRFIAYKAKPGPLQLTAQRGGLEVFKRETELDLPVEAGKSYYVRCDVKSSVTRTRLELAEVTENTAKRDMEKLTADNCQETADAK